MAPAGSARIVEHREYIGSGRTKSRRPDGSSCAPSARRPEAPLEALPGFRSRCPRSADTRRRSPR
eukprot:5301794-Prymnesium_polylepis.1